MPIFHDRSTQNYGPSTQCYGIPFVWDGDLADDCTCRVGNLIAHCECLGKRSGLEVWFVSVGPVDHRGMACGPDLFHSGEPAGIIIGGDMARAIAEAILLAAKP